MNINRLLENSRRTSLIGRNVYTFEGFHRNGEWDAPRMGFSGRAAIGHETPVCDVLTPELYDGERKLTFAPVRHRWTPAWMDTYYRSTADEEYYPNSGCIAVRETKCITEDDVFVSRIELRNDKRETAWIRIRLASPFERDEIHMPVRVGALGCEPELNVCCALLTDRGPGKEFVLEVQPHGSAAFTCAWSVSKEGRAEAEERARRVLGAENPFAERECSFNRFMEENVPKLICDETEILKIYYYRWFLVYRALHNPSAVIDGHPVEGDCLYESPYGSWYGCPVGLPVPHHLEEAKWMRTRKTPFSDAEQWLKGAACYQGWGYIQYTPMAMWHLYENHPDRAFLERAYPVCRAWALKDFHPEAEGISFLPVIGSSWPTGAEYQPAFYQHTREPWDWTQDEEGRAMGIAEEELRLYRLDHICYSIGNLIGCAKMAEEMERKEEAEELSALAGRAIDLLWKYFWCSEKQCFVSVDAVSLRQCDEALCYDSFFPFLWGMAGEECEAGWETLFDRSFFACDFGLTTADRNCPMYWFDNCIAGPAKSSLREPHAYACCWNGPVWPYAVSGVAEALGEAAVRSERLRGQWLRLFEGYTELHFMQGDRSVPMVTEHYRPTDGVSFRDTCDYFHSTWIDPFMKYWAGVRKTDSGIVFEPFAECEFEIRNISVGGKTYCVRQYKENNEMKRVVREMNSGEIPG